MTNIAKYIGNNFDKSTRAGTEDAVYKIVRVVAGDGSQMLPIPGVECTIYIGDDSMAYISTSQLNALLGRSYNYRPKTTTGNLVMDTMPANLRPFLSERTLQIEPVLLEMPHGRPMIAALPVTILARIPTDIVRAHAKGATYKSQKNIVLSCVDIIERFSERGVVQATYDVFGFDHRLGMREQSAQYLPDTTVAVPCTWDSIFPVDFWRNLDRLYGDVASEKYGPREVKRLYETLGAGTYVRLQQRRDAHEGTRGRLHQYLTPENRELLRRHVQRCVELLSVSQTLGGYRELFFMEFGKMSRRLLAPVDI